MPDFLVRQIDERLAVQIKEHARLRQLTLNDALLELIQAGLKAHGSPGAMAALHVATDDDLEPRVISTGWNSDEASALVDAIRALERLPR